MLHALVTVVCVWRGVWVLHAILSLCECKYDDYDV